ncbi:MAG: tol-pal system-associated acyl-CoA thioesterase [Burkholderiales bacterium]
MKTLSVPVRVYYQDTDAGGVVFHAQYLAFMERARTELLNEAGIDLARMADETGAIFFVHEVRMKFLRPALLNERLSVSAEVVRMGRASIVFRQRVERDGELLVEAEVGVATVHRQTRRPVRMPQAVTDAFVTTGAA